MAKLKAGESIVYPVWPGAGYLLDTGSTGTMSLIAGPAPAYRLPRHTGLLAAF
jgi:hypothetical protein